MIANVLPCPALRTTRSSRTSGARHKRMARAAHFLCKVHKPSLACNRMERERSADRKSASQEESFERQPSWSPQSNTLYYRYNRQIRIRKPISFLKSGRDERPRLRCRVEMRPRNRRARASKAGPRAMSRIGVPRHARRPSRRAQLPPIETSHNPERSRDPAPRRTSRPLPSTWQPSRQMTAPMSRQAAFEIAARYATRRTHKRDNCRAGGP